MRELFRVLLIESETEKQKQIIIIFFSGTISLIAKLATELATEFGGAQKNPRSGPVRAVGRADEVGPGCS